MGLNSEDIIQEIHELDALVWECVKDGRVASAHIARGVGGREVSLAITKLQEARSWLTLAVVELTPKQPTEGTANE